MRGQAITLDKFSCKPLIDCRVSKNAWKKRLTNDTYGAFVIRYINNMLEKK